MTQSQVSSDLFEDLVCSSNDTTTGNTTFSGDNNHKNNEIKYIVNVSIYLVHTLTILSKIYAYRHSKHTNTIFKIPK